MKKIYLDYAATTPVGKEVLEAMRPYFSEKYGNPGSLHSFGQEAIAAIDKSREIIAKAIHSEFNDIIFTGSATEANNLALRGAVRRYWWKFFKENGGKKEGTVPHIVTTVIEHESVLETLRDMENRGAASVTVLPVSRDGIVRLESLRKALRKETILVSVMFANNEIGTIQPLFEISKAIKDFNYEIFLHTDAVQAFQYLDCNVNVLGVDLMTLSAHKIYGPKGVGALFARQKLESRNEKLSSPSPLISNLSPLITGGGQEFSFRSGTENVPSIVGFAKAVELIISLREKETRRISELRNYFWEELKKIYPKAEVNGIMNDKSGINNSGGILKYTTQEGKKDLIHNSLINLPNILNVYFPDYKADELLIKFDMAGVAVSAGSACRARSVEPSHVVEALGLGEERARRSIRFSFGRPTTKSEINEVLKRTRSILG